MNGNDERGIVPILNSTHSTVKIDSLCIKLGIVKEKDDAPKCRHFSIRGYVAGMREKGSSRLLPYTEELPPMDIPNFRYWLCEKCLQNNETANASTETTLISKCDQCVLSPSARSCPQQEINRIAVLPFGEGTSGLKPVDSKNNDETILAALEADESQTSQEIPDRVKVFQELTKLCTIDTSAGKKGSNDLKDHENPQKTSIVNETIGQPLECGQQIDNYQNGHPRRKARKVRLLKELLCGNNEIKQHKKDNSSSSLPSHIKRKMLHDHDHDLEHEHDHNHNHDHDHDHHLDSKKAKPFKGDATAKNNVVEHSSNPGGREFGGTINKYEWNKHGTQRSSNHGKVGSDAMTAWRSIFSDMGRPDNWVPPTCSVSKSSGTEPYPNFLNPLKSDKKANSLKKISSNPIKSKFFVEDSRRMMDDSRPNTGLGLDLSLNYDPQSHVRSQLPILNRPPNQDYSRRSGFFLGESGHFPHRIQTNSIKPKERSVHEKQLYSQLPYGRCSGHQRLDFSDPYKRNIGVGGYSEFTRPSNHQRQDKVFSIGRSDEREIVELMAKNQYERNLCEANNGIISGFHKPMNEGMTSSRHDYLTMIRPTSSSIGSSENTGIMRNPAGGFFHQERVSSFSMNQKKPLNGVWMSDSGPQRHYDSRYHYASIGNNKKPQPHLYNPSNMQVFEAFNKYNNGTHQHDMQFGQTYAKYSDKDKGKTMMDLDLNLVAPNAIEEQNNFESLDLNRNRMCSFDSSYSNEAIPALQLLSLMDAGKLSQPFSMTNQTCVTKPKPNPNSSCFSHCSSTVTEKTNPMVNPIGSSHSGVFRTGQNVKLTTSSHGQQVYHKQQEVKSRGASLASVCCRPEGSYVYPLPWQASEGQNKVVNRAFGPRSDSSITEICTINRNPADFSSPGPENVYMINVEDLVFNGENPRGSNNQKKAMKPTS